MDKSKVDITKILSNIQEIKGRKVFALDIETSGLLPWEHNIEVVTLKQNGKKEIEFAHINKLRKEGTDLEYFKNLRNKLKNNAVIGHNIIFDFGFLLKYGIDPIRDNIYILDTLIASKIDRGNLNMVSEMNKYPHMQKSHYTPLFKQKHNLGVVCWLYLKLELDKELQRSDWTKEELSDEQIRYAKNDVKYLAKIYAAQYRSIKEKDLLNVLKLEEAAIAGMIDLNAHTLYVNKEKGHQLTVKLADAIKITVEKYNSIVLKRINEIYGSIDNLENKYINQKWINYKLNSKAKKKTKEVTFKNARKREMKKGALYSKEGFKILIPKEKAIFKMFFKDVYNIDLKSTDKVSIENLAKQGNELAILIPTLVKQIKEFYDIDKAIMFTKPNGRVVTQFNQIGAVTGRMSSSGVGVGNNKVGLNMQQINKDPDFRDIFEAGPGKTLVLADYSGMELRIIAAVTEENNMLDAFKKNISLHSLAAANILNMDLKKFQAIIDNKKDIKHGLFSKKRSVAKTMNFAIAYGAGAATISDKAGISLADADKAKKDYLINNPNIAKYIKEQTSKTVVESLIGRKMNTTRVIGKKDYYSISQEWKRKQCKKVNFGLWVQQGYSQNFNFPIQSTGVDIAKLALVLVINHKDFVKDNIHATHFVHDEIALEVPLELAEKWKIILQKEMERAGAIITENKVFMEADANSGKTWNNAK